jgi:hypothetical protein
MEAISSSETSAASQQTTGRHIPEDDTFHKHRCENLKSYIVVLIVKSFKANNTVQVKNFYINNQRNLLLYK